MKKNLLVMAGVVSAMALATAVQAMPIPAGSEIDMSGTATLNNQYLGSATAVTGFSAVTVGGTPTGVFSGVTAGTSVSWNPFGWNPATTPVTPLWSFGAYSFDLSSVTVVSQSNSYLNLAGSGVLNATGYDPTQGSWSFTISNAGGGAHQTLNFTFANSQVSVPDGGMTVMMLGMALCGLALLSFRKARTT